MANVALMEPLLLRENSPRYKELLSLAFSLTRKSASLRASFSPIVAESIHELVRSMNCYYSNLIEGHNTHPIDIERALQSEYSDDEKKRDLQLEAKAHIETQKWVEAGGLNSHVASAESILAIHKYFCERLPEELLWVENPDTGEKERVVPGELRTSYVRVGNHVAVAPEDLPSFLQRFESVYGGLCEADLILAIAACHHRFLWMHPFSDGNGRVARLMSQVLFDELFSTGGLWSVSRGLAKNKTEYIALISQCDMGRRNDYDGRGSLSEEALVELTRFFLTVGHDQVDFMQSLFKPEKLSFYVLRWVDAEIADGNLPAKARVVVNNLLLSGELARKEIAELTGLGERAARELASTLKSAGVIRAPHKKAPYRLNFSVANAEHWLPNLFPPR